MNQKEVYLTKKQNIAFLEDKKKKLFNCLHMFEASDPTAYKSIHTMIREMEGRAKRFPFFAEHMKYQHVIDTLENLYDYFLVINQDEHSIVRSDILKSLHYLDAAIKDVNGKFKGV
ncbi:hypothetical protein [Bacillus sp. Marseille-P3800]|uniref:hypothetical protein n=1 Tax=Bacillus sp. Marseille-P3800 TaxID=2014782 RepID=UPI000C0897E6|nr:hypothetical protein [Bacillus sp. Marseille-P3800]